MSTRDATPTIPLDLLFSPSERWGLQQRAKMPFLTPEPLVLLPGLTQLIARLGEKYQRRHKILLLAIVCLGLLLGSLMAPEFVIPVTLVIVIPGGVSILVMLWQQSEMDSWTAARQAHNRAEWDAVTTLPGTRRVDVYGGTPDGWEALITTFGASCLGSGNRLTVIDLSEYAVAGELCNLAIQQGVSVNVVSLPEELAEFDALANLSPEEIRDILIEVLEGDEKGGASYRSRALSDRVLGEVCDILRPRVTLDRILAALRAILGQEPEPPTRGGLLTPDEWLAVKDLFRDEARREARERIVALESELYQLKGLGANAPTREQKGHQLKCIALNISGQRVRNDYLKRLLVQLLIRSFRSVTGRAAGSEVYLVAGADAIERRYLEQLSDLSHRRGVRLIYMFSQLRDDTGEMLGGGGSAAAFMRLGNPAQAERAANYIGKEYKFELSQLTHSTSNSTTHTSSANEGKGDGITKSGFLNYQRSTTRNWGTSESVARGITTQEGSTTSRVHEYAVEPTILQRLPETAMLIAQLDAARGGRIVQACDCNPDLLTLPEDRAGLRLQSGPAHPAPGLAGSLTEPIRPETSDLYDEAYELVDELAERGAAPTKGDNPISPELQAQAHALLEYFYRNDVWLEPLASGDLGVHNGKLSAKTRAEVERLKPAIRVILSQPYHQMRRSMVRQPRETSGVGRLAIFVVILIILYGYLI